MGLGPVGTEVEEAVDGVGREGGVGGVVVVVAEGVGIGVDGVEGVVEGFRCGVWALMLKWWVRALDGDAGLVQSNNRKGHLPSIAKDSFLSLWRQVGVLGMEAE